MNNQQVTFEPRKPNIFQQKGQIPINKQHKQYDLKTIEQQGIEQQHTIDFYVATTPIQSNKNKKRNSNKKLKRQDQENEYQTIKNRNSKNNNRKTKTQQSQSDKISKLSHISDSHSKNKGKSKISFRSIGKDPILSCIYVPFMENARIKSLKKKQNYNLQSDFFQEYKKIIDNKIRHNRTQSLSCHSIKNRKQSHSLPAINMKKINEVQNFTEIKHKKRKPSFNPGPFLQNEKSQKQKKRIYSKQEKLVTKQQGTSTDQFDLNKSIPKLPIIDSHLLQNNTSNSKYKIVFKNQIQDSKFQSERNIRILKLQEFEKKKKKFHQKNIRKNYQVEEKINYFKVKTCFYHIRNISSQDYSSFGKTQKRRKISESILNLEFSHLKIKSNRSADKSNISIVKNQSLIHKLPSSKEEITQFIKRYKIVNNFQTEIKHQNFPQLHHLIQSEKFGIKFEKGVYLYFGQIKKFKNQALYHGYGVLLKQNYLFEGLFQMGLKQKGIQIKQNGVMFKGQFKHGRKEGFGIQYWDNNKETYSGEWKNGMKNGTGIWKNFKGDQYKGQWVNGKVQGYGVHQTRQGQIYQGQFVNFLKQGKGKQFFPNGDQFQGIYSEGKAQGIGLYTFHKHNMYFKGSFHKGLRHGKGSLIKINSFKYSGQFYQDLVQGYGKIQYENKDIYQGNFKDGQRHGYGQLLRSRQNRFLKGEWTQGVFQSSQH